MPYKQRRYDLLVRLVKYFNRDRDVADSYIQYLNPAQSTRINYKNAPDFPVAQKCDAQWQNLKNIVIHILGDEKNIPALTTVIKLTNMTN